MWFMIAVSLFKLRILPLVFSYMYLHLAPIQVFEIQTVSSKWLTMNDNVEVLPYSSDDCYDNLKFTL